jgi:ubiquinone/menaquinone biosynthesis C-methylase UbiE
MTLTVASATTEEDAYQITHAMLKECVKSVDSTILKNHLHTIYSNACPDLSAQSIKEIADTLLDIIQESENLAKLHRTYIDKIHEPYGLSQPMTAARQRRAEAIGAKVATLMQDSSHPDLPILDYGAGGGEPAKEVNRRTGRTVIAADVDNFLKEGMPETVVFTPIYQGKMLDKVADKSVGDAFASYAFHHADGMDYDTQFSELHRVLADGGKLHVFETGVANDANHNAYTDKSAFLQAQFLDVITSNFFRTEPVMMPVPGNYYPEGKWVDHAEKAGFHVESIKNLGRDSFGEACFDMTFSR